MQTNIDGMIFVFENLRICQIYKNADAETFNGETENWTNVLDVNRMEWRVRSKECKNILSFYSKVGHCQVCIEKYKRAITRGISNQDKDILEPKIAKLENTNIITLERNNIHPL